MAFKALSFINAQGVDVADFYFLIEGEEADTAADVLVDAIGSSTVVRTRTSHPAGATNKLFDPISIGVVSVMLAIPGATFAAVNLSDRARKAKADQVLQIARSAQTQYSVRITVRPSDGSTWEIERIESHELVELAEFSKQ